MLKRVFILNKILETLKNVFLHDMNQTEKRNWKIDRQAMKTKPNKALNYIVITSQNLYFRFHKPITFSKLIGLLQFNCVAALQ